MDFVTPGAREAIEKLNQENFLLQQRLLHLEKLVKSFKNHSGQSVHPQPCFIKSELTSYAQNQPKTSFQKQCEQQQSFNVKKYEEYSTFNFLGKGDLTLQETSFDRFDPFDFELNTEELNYFLNTPQHDFPNW